MNSQNLILLGIGLFVSVIVATLAYNEFQQLEHRPTEPGGLIWQVNSAFDRIRDLEAVLEIEVQPEMYDPLVGADSAFLDVAAFLPTPSAGTIHAPFQILLQYVNDEQPALLLRYPVGDDNNTNDELIVIDNGRLSHYLPFENAMVTRLWPARLPLITLGLMGFHLKTVEDEWDAGRVSLRVLQDVSGLPPGLFQAAMDLGFTLSGDRTGAGAICFRASHCPPLHDWSFVSIQDPMSQSSIQGGYILEVRDAGSDMLEAMIWVDRGDYTILKTVRFVDGMRAYSIRAQRIEINPGLLRDNLVVLPRVSLEIEAGS
ncbi:MAG: hypothetical protein JSW65_02105 [Candidatus Bipolaricaulota bacterium]|nr:MAG: hypothetical protein JSW65_02105 [Candidatus Bipolaricaulota bacterium]